MHFSVALAALIGSASSAIIWDGRFNSFSTSAEISNWSWSNQVGPYQYYIHGPSAISSYINLSSSYKNPADSGSAQGAKFTLDSTSFWNGQTMRRTELIPQTTAAITSGKVWYHFSMSRSATNAPSIYREHQINFFESHFTEMKSGWISGASGNSNPALQWFVGGQSKWSVNWEAGVWHNVAYEIDFSANTVAFWHSTGSDPLTLTVAAIGVSTSSNGADWHLGALELPVSGQADSNEDFYFSGVYIESGSLTKSVAGPGGAVVVSSSSAVAATSSTPSKPTSACTLRTSTVKPTTLSTSISTAQPTTSKPAAPTTTSSAPTPGGTLAKYNQCGGIGWGGSGTCVEGTKCIFSNDYYSQCL
ncbi:related to endoglucanase c [Rhynchosporium agropyri]|uniref:Related to endoglucanase c n=1 Tax=Rhynchosporium agropyri TaxID=914238 RepID=A0A1E1L3N1_9HELO|nr:related to endoglucanase c [Rhynchosporium agropyri]